MEYYSDDGPCKHMDVFNGLLSFTQDLVSKPRVRRVIPEGFLSIGAALELSSKGFAREDVLQYKNELARGIGGRWNHSKVGCADIQRYSRREIYETTTTGCMCPDYQRYPYNWNCKHIRRMRNIEALASAAVAPTAADDVVQEIVLLVPQVAPTAADDVVQDTTNQVVDMLNNISKEISSARENIAKEKAIFAKEKEDFRELLGLCCVCYEGKTIKVGCCSAKMCAECWYGLEESSLSASHQCPCCRAPLPSLVRVLIAKFNE
jgi:hypothetical protein